MLPALARRFRAIAPDFPGFGASDRPRAAYSPACFAEFVTGFLDALHVPSAVVVGNSLGGLAAPRFAQARDAVGWLRRGRLVVIPDCGHLPQIERPELFLEALGSFLGGPIAGAESGGSHAG